MSTNIEEELSREQFSVYQFFRDGTYERVCAFVSIDEAIAKARHYTTSVAAQTGITRRVIITDGGDCVCFEWLFGKGVTNFSEVGPEEG